MRKTRILASLLCVMMIVCAIPMIQASAAVTEAAPGANLSNMITVWSDDFSAGTTPTTGWTVNSAVIEPENGNNILHAGNLDEAAVTIKFQDHAKLNLEKDDFTFRFKVKMSGGTKGYIGWNNAFGSKNTASSQNIGFANAGLGMSMDTWYDWAYVYSYDSDAAAQTVDIYARYQNEDGSWSDWSKKISDLAVANDTSSNKNRFTMSIARVGGNQEATDMYFDDFAVMLDMGTEQDLAKNAVIWQDNLDDNDISDWTTKGNYTMVDGVAKLDNGAELIFSNDKFGKLNNQDFSFRFKAKVSGNETETPNANLINPQPSFGAGQRLSLNLGYNNFTLTQDVWYDFLYSYSATTADTGYQSVDVFYRTSSDRVTWSEWKVGLKNQVETVAGSQSNRVQIVAPGTAYASNKATEFYFDDFAVVIPMEYNIDKEDVGVIWKEDFRDNATTGWRITGDSVVAENGVLHASSSGSARVDNPAFALANKDFSFGFKAKMNADGYMALDAAFGTDQRLQRYLGWNNASATVKAPGEMLPNIWYEYLYEYDYDEAAAKQYINIYQRYEMNNGWSAWETLQLGQLVESATYDNMFIFEFPAVNGASNPAATEFWLDDLVVYTHERTAQTVATGVTYARNFEKAFFTVDGNAIPDSASMFVAEYGADTLDRVQKINGTNGSYEITIPTEKPYKIFFWDAALNSIFNAISE